MEEIDPKTRTFKLDRDDVILAIYEYAKKGKRNLDGDSVEFSLQSKVSGTPAGPVDLEVTGATVKFKIVADPKTM